MDEFKQRLLIEKSELDARRERLESFSTSTDFMLIDVRQQSLLNIQRHIMCAYSQVLLERITLIEDQTD